MGYKLFCAALVALVYIAGSGEPHGAVTHLQFVMALIGAVAGYAGAGAIDYVLDRLAPRIRT